jgi:hypothetical protein
MPDQWRTIRTAEDADAIRDHIESVHSGWFTGPDPIDWEDFIDRLDGRRMENGSLIDMGGQLDSAAIRRIKAIVRELRAD